MKKTNNKPLWIKGDRSSFLDYVCRELSVSAHAMFDEKSNHVFHSFNIGELNGRSVRMILTIGTDEHENAILQMIESRSKVC